MRVSAESDMLDEIFSGIDSTVYDMIMVFDKEDQEMHITVADPATVQMIDLSVPAESFESFEISLDDHEEYQEDKDREALYIGVNAENFYSMISELSGEIVLTIEKNNLVISDDNNQFSLATINIDIDEDIPPYNAAEMDLSSSFKLDMADLKDARKKAALIAEEIFVKIIPEDDQLKIYTGNDNDSFETYIDLEDAEGETAESRFPLSYIEGVEKYFTGLSTLDDAVNIELGEGQPIRFYVNTDREDLETLIAPRLDGPMS